MTDAEQLALDGLGGDRCRDCGSAEVVTYHPPRCAPCVRVAGRRGVGLPDQVADVDGRRPGRRRAADDGATVKWCAWCYRVVRGDRCSTCGHETTDVDAESVQTSAQAAAAHALDVRCSKCRAWTRRAWLELQFGPGARVCGPCRGRGERGV